MCNDSGKPDRRRSAKRRGIRRSAMSVRKTHIAVFLFAALVTSLLYGQIRSATITGTVRDSSGAVVPEANVVVTEQDTGAVTTVKTTAAGIFTAPYLAAGSYTV